MGNDVFKERIMKGYMIISGKINFNGYVKDAKFERGFPGGPAMKTLSCQCKGHGFNP